MGSSVDYVCFEGKYYSTVTGKNQVHPDAQTLEFYGQNKITGTCRPLKLWIAKEVPTTESHAFVQYEDGTNEVRTDKIILGCTGGWLVDEKMHPSVYRYLPKVY